MHLTSMQYLRSQDMSAQGAKIPLFRSSRQVRLRAGRVEIH